MNKAAVSELRSAAEPIPHELVFSFMGKVK
jgi:hypothetical protein